MDRYEGEVVVGESTFEELGDKILGSRAHGASSDERAAAVQAIIAEAESKLSELVRISVSGIELRQGEAPPEAFDEIRRLVFKAGDAGDIWIIGASKNGFPGFTKEGQAKAIELARFIARGVGIEVKSDGTARRAIQREKLLNLGAYASSEVAVTLDEYLFMPPSMQAMCKVVPKMTKPELDTVVSNAKKVLKGSLVENIVPIIHLQHEKSTATGPTQEIDRKLNARRNSIARTISDFRYLGYEVISGIYEEGISHPRLTRIFLTEKGLTEDQRNAKIKEAVQSTILKVVETMGWRLGPDRIFVRTVYEQQADSVIPFAAEVPAAARPQAPVAITPTPAVEAVGGGADTLTGAGGNAPYAPVISVPAGLETPPIAALTPAQLAAANADPDARLPRFNGLGPDGTRLASAPAARPTATSGGGVNPVDPALNGANPFGGGEPAAAVDVTPPPEDANANAIVEAAIKKEIERRILFVAMKNGRAVNMPALKNYVEGSAKENPHIAYEVLRHISENGIEVSAQTLPDKKDRDDAKKLSMTIAGEAIELVGLKLNDDGTWKVDADDAVRAYIRLQILWAAKSAGGKNFNAGMEALKSYITGKTDAQLEIIRQTTAEIHDNGLKGLEEQQSKIARAVTEGLAKALGMVPNADGKLRTPTQAADAEPPIDSALAEGIRAMRDLLRGKAQPSGGAEELPPPAPQPPQPPQPQKTVDAEEPPKKGWPKRALSWAFNTARENKADLAISLTASAASFAVKGSVVAVIASTGVIGTALVGSPILAIAATGAVVGLASGTAAGSVRTIVSGFRHWNNDHGYRREETIRKLTKIGYNEHESKFSQLLGERDRFELPPDGKALAFLKKKGVKFEKNESICISNYREDGKYHLTVNGEEISNADLSEVAELMIDGYKWKWKKQFLKSTALSTIGGALGGTVIAPLISKLGTVGTGAAAGTAAGLVKLNSDMKNDFRKANDGEEAAASYTLRGMMQRVSWLSKNKAKAAAYIFGGAAAGATLGFAAENLWDAAQKVREQARINELDRLRIRALHPVEPSQATLREAAEATARVAAEDAAEQGRRMAVLGAHSDMAAAREAAEVAAREAAEAAAREAAEAAAREQAEAAAREAAEVAAREAAEAAETAAREQAETAANLASQPIVNAPPPPAPEPVPGLPALNDIPRFNDAIAEAPALPNVPPPLPMPPTDAMPAYGASVDGARVAEMERELSQSLPPSAPEVPMVEAPAAPPVDAPPAAEAPAPSPEPAAEAPPEPAPVADPAPVAADPAPAAEDPAAEAPRVEPFAEPEALSRLAPSLEDLGREAQPPAAEAPAPAAVDPAPFAVDPAAEAPRVEPFAEPERLSDSAPSLEDLGREAQPPVAADPAPVAADPAPVAADPAPVAADPAPAAADPAPAAVDPAPVAADPAPAAVDPAPAAADPAPAAADPAPAAADPAPAAADPAPVAADPAPVAADPAPAAADPAPAAVDPAPAAETPRVERFAEPERLSDSTPPLEDLAREAQPPAAGEVPAPSPEPAAPPADAPPVPELTRAQRIEAAFTGHSTGPYVRGLIAAAAEDTPEGQRAAYRIAEGIANQKLGFRGIPTERAMEFIRMAQDGPNPREAHVARIAEKVWWQMGIAGARDTSDLIDAGRVANPSLPAESTVRGRWAAAIEQRTAPRPAAPPVTNHGGGITSQPLLSPAPQAAVQLPNGITAREPVTPVDVNRARSAVAGTLQTAALQPFATSTTHVTGQFSCSAITADGSRIRCTGDSRFLAEAFPEGNYPVNLGAPSLGPPS